MEEIRTLLKRDPPYKCGCDMIECNLFLPGAWNNRSGHPVLCYMTSEEFVDTAKIHKAELVFTPNKVAEAYKVQIGDYNCSVIVHVGPLKEYHSTHRAFDRLIKRACKQFGKKAVWVHMELRCPKEEK